MAGTLAVLVPVMLELLTMQGMASLLGTTWYTLYRHKDAYGDAIGVVAVVAVTVLVVVAGRWALAGALTATVAQIAAVLPVTIAFEALPADDPLRWLAALSGVALGALIAGVRWRVPVAAALAVLTALTLFIAYDATTEDPEKLVAQHVATPAVLILILCAAVAGAVTGATAPALAAQGALPVVLGPLVGVLAVGGLQAVQVTQESGPAGTPYDVIPSAFLFLVAGLAISGLGLARLLTARSAERKHAQQIRRESAAAERDRLGRSIHDGVLQVLALVQREGQDLGGHAGELAALAAQQEVALRSLLASEASEANNAGKRQERGHRPPRSAAGADRPGRRGRHPRPAGAAAVRRRRGGGRGGQGRPRQRPQARRPRCLRLDPSRGRTRRRSRHRPRRRRRLPARAPGRGRRGGPPRDRPVDARPDRRLRRNDDHRQPPGPGHRGRVLDTPRAAGPPVNVQPRTSNRPPRSA